MLVIIVLVVVMVVTIVMIIMVIIVVVGVMIGGKLEVVAIGMSLTLATLGV